MEKMLAVLFIMFILFCIGPLFIMLGWSLFMVPVFSLKSLAFSEAIGFMLMAAAFRGMGYKK